MKIVYFMNHVGTGGAALALYDLIYELKKKGHIEMVVFTGKYNELNKELSKIGVENYSAPFKNFLSSYKSPKCLWKLLLQIRYWICKPIACHKIEKIIDFSKVDIIHTNLNRIDIGAYFSQKYNIPHIWHIREHGEGDFDLISLYRKYINYMERYTSIYVAISHSVKQIWNKRGIPGEKIRLIYDGIRTDELARNYKGINKNLRIIFLGGYDGNKGQSHLIDALGRISKSISENIEVDFFGSGKHKYIVKLQDKIKNYNLEKSIRVQGYQSDIYRRLVEYDIGINCSKAEGFGRVTVEYMMAGLCPIASDTGANTELITDNVTGMVYQYGNIYELSNKILYAYKNRKEIYKLGMQAQKHAIERFSMKRHAEQILKLYIEVLSNEREMRT